MGSLSYWLAAGAYVALSVWLFFWLWRLARQRSGDGTRRRFGRVLIALLVACYMVFWDAVPVTLVRNHDCANEAGLQVDESPQAWIQRNSDRLDDLRISPQDRATWPSSIDEAGWQVSALNKALVWKNRRTLMAPALLNIHLVEDEIVDVRDGRRLMRLKDYEAGRQLVTQTLRPQPYFPSCSNPRRAELIAALGLLEGLGR